MKAFAIVGVLTVFLVSAGLAQAKTAIFNGSAPHPKPGQTKGLPVLIGIQAPGPALPNRSQLLQARQGQ